MSACTEALAEYQRTSLIVDAIDSDKNEQAFDAAADIQGEAMEVLLSTPAPDLSAVGMKLQVMQRTGNQHLAPILADIERLGLASPAAGELERTALKPAQTNQCSRCRFWRLDKSSHSQGGPLEEGDIAFGHCRRNAPVVAGALAALGVPRTAWGRDADMEDEDLSSTQIYRASPQPVTESADWCGEYVAGMEA